MTFIESYAKHYDIDHDQAVARLQIASDACEKLSEWLRKNESHVVRTIADIHEAASEIEPYTED